MVQGRSRRLLFSPIPGSPGMGPIYIIIIYIQIVPGNRIVLGAVFRAVDVVVVNESVLGINRRRKPHDSIDVHVVGITFLIGERPALYDQFNNLPGVVIVQQVSHLVEVAAVDPAPLVVDKEIDTHTDVQFEQHHLVCP